MSLNLIALEYVVEIAKHGSISKAAQHLFISQPHLSNQIKSIEKQLGVKLFHRSAKGIQLTREGKIFLDDAQAILGDIKSLQSKLQIDPQQAVQGSISVTRSYQVNRCITQFINENSNKSSFAFRIKETNPFQLVMSKESSLAKEETIYSDMLDDNILVIYGDYEIPAASYEDIGKSSGSLFSSKRIYVYDRASAMEILHNCPQTYMWSTGLHSDTLSMYNLEMRRCENIKIMNLGGSIYSSDEPLSWSTNAVFQKMLKIDWNEDIK